MSVKHIEAFINLCRDITDKCARLDANRPAWGAGVVSFQRMFAAQPEKFEKIFSLFAAANPIIEKPILPGGGAVNDKWLTSGLADAPVTSTWAKRGVAARGVVLPFSADEPKLASYYLPLTELYGVCIQLNKDQSNLGHISYENVPAVFLQKLYKCLNSIEPSNFGYEKNLNDLNELIQENIEAAKEADASDSDADKSEGDESDSGANDDPFSKMLKSFDIEKMLAKVAQVPMFRKMAKQSLKLNDAELDGLVETVPDLIAGMQESVTGESDASVAELLLENESIQTIMQKNPEKIAKVKSFFKSKKGKSTMKAVSGAIGAIEDQVCDVATEQDGAVSDATKDYEGDEDAGDQE